MKRIVSVILCFFALNCISAQNVQKADKLFSEKQYTEAGQLYAQLLSRNPKQALFNYRYARCLYEQNKNEEAIYYFLKSGNKYPLTEFYLGEANFREYLFDEALEHFNEYIASIDSLNPNYNFTNQRIVQCRLGARLIKHVQDIVIIDTQVVAVKDFLKFYRLSAEAGNVSIKDDFATYTNSRDNRRVITGIGESGWMALFSSERIMDGWTEKTPFFADDNSNVNYPFLLSDGVTLFYGSDSNDGMGGWDIYTTRYNSSSEGFYKPENMGFPFNSPFNDYMLAVDEATMQGWFATDRYCPLDSVKIITFAWNDGEKRYYDADDANARSFAQLRNLTLVESAAINTPLISPAKVDHYSATAQDINSPVFQFVVAEGIIYESYSDFRNSDAREMYRAYRKAYELYENDLLNLDKLRLQYGEASSENRVPLAEKIQRLEVSTEKQLAALKQKENQIRQLEQIQL